MDYKKYKLEDFLSDKQFIDWVINPSDEQDYFWQKWCENNSDKSHILNQARSIILKFRYKEYESNVERYNKVLRGILRDERPNRVEPKPLFSNYKKQDVSVMWARVAATISFFAIFSFVIYLNNASLLFQGNQIAKNYDIRNPKGKRSSLMLPDSSMVTLNADSRIIYHSDFETTREVELQGEAFFNVKKKGSVPFVVKSGEISTKVYGTKFNVKAHNDEQIISVALVEGVVKVESYNETDTMLTALQPKEKLRYNLENKEISKSNFNLMQEIGWKDGILVFNHSSLEYTINAIERWYDVEVVLEGKPVANWEVTGEFQNENIIAVLESISFAKGMKYKVSDRVVLLDFKTKK